MQMQVSNQSQRKNMLVLTFLQIDTTLLVAHSLIFHNNLPCNHNLCEKEHTSGCTLLNFNGYYL